ncbi:PTS fructose-like transporter subunit IIB [Pseudodesulfovibrio sediminis]|uniref:protein-N(pi)-phosphohistidine--D-fructose phosphotransferase n=1 Tax=Pseudodesulfovibrio sediminis TaxID=2810563 RepID=A0ABM7P9Y6_9BACT|nr:PTS fructose-like transporter subunit IIB [Pseudodesulfovibrio sediminis]BCS89888.1 PTS fructose transporter subunit IIBC [Pseudodesulfovibrio sediminis]
MSKIVAVTACPTGVAHTIMAAEALKKVGASMGHEVSVETQGAEGTKDVLSESGIAAAEVVIIAADIHVDAERFQGKPLYAVTTSTAIRDTEGVIKAALDEAASMTAAPTDDAVSGSKFVIGVTSCPTGIAHTFMAAEALRKAGEKLGYEMKIETQGSVGAKNVLTDEDIARADAVVIAADAFVDTARFAAKPLYETTTKAALHEGEQAIKSALAALPGSKAGLVDQVSEIKKERSAVRTGPYRHLMTGVSYMLPVVVAGGLLIALAFAFGGIYAGDNEGTFGWALMQIGGAGAFSLFVPVLAAFIAFSIAQRPGITPGLVGGLLATNVGAGFLGGIVAGFIAGYLTQFLNDKIKLPENLQGLKPVLILPFISTLVVGLLMIYVIGPPVKIALTSLSEWLKGMQSGSAVGLGLLLGAMMAFDMGGPVNKAAYTFGVGLLSASIYEPMAAIMAAGMTPPLGLALAATLFKNRFTEDEREASKAAFVLGLSFITEGAIPFAARDPFRVIPSIMLGSAVTGAISMGLKCTLMVPHGGIFVLPIPNAVTHLAAYAGAIVVGTVVTAGALFFAKRPLPEEAA